MHRYVAVLLLVTIPTLAQTSDWEALKALRQGEKIWIRYHTGGKVRSGKGDMIRQTDDALVVRLNRNETTIPRADVRRVSVYAGKSRGRGAGIGALAGGAAGAGVYAILVGVSHEDLDVNPGLIVVGGALLFAGVGAVVGLAVGATKTRPIYEAPAK